MEADAGRYAMIDGILTGARRLTGNEREIFLAAACGGDGRLLSEVQELLTRANDEAGPFADAWLDATRRRLEEPFPPRSP